MGVIFDTGVLIAIERGSQNVERLINRCSNDGKLLFRLGFKRVRQKGSHVFYRYPDGRTTTVPLIRN
jgi:hypothetical protein